jgi:putative peptidoglycan lipid II flippase
VKVLTPGYYARSDTRTPVRYATISMVVNLVLNLALIVPLQHMGPPLATALASTVNVLLLYRTLRLRGHFEPDRRLLHRAWRLTAAALVMGGILWLLQGLLTPYLHGSWTIRTGAMLALVGAGGFVYAVATFVLGAFTRDDLAFLRRKRAK